MVNEVVITGIGIIAPNGVGKRDYWNAVISGDSGIKKVSRFNTEDCPVKIAGEVSDFRPQDYMDKKEAKHLSRFAQFALAATDMAICDSDIKIEKEDPYRIGIVLGTAGGGKEVDEAQKIIFENRGYKRLSPFSASLISNNFAVGVIASEYKIKGPNTTFSNGCNSAFSAISYAYELLNNDSVDIVITGGSETPLTPFVYNLFCAAGVLSIKNIDPKRASKPFDKRRDGYVLSEGCGIIILERLQHALKRKADIYAQIKGYGVTNDAYNYLKMEPTGKEVVNAIKIALQKSNVSANEINYINAHGSSSKLADKRETYAIKEVFKECAYKIPISSIKSMIGQPLGATGSLQVATSALAIKNGCIPPTINYEEQDPECDLDYTPNKSKKYNINNVLINSFGLGGSNMSMILGKY